MPPFSPKGPFSPKTPHSPKGPFSPKAAARSYNVRSVSFPARSHPNIRRIEEELNKQSTWNESRIHARLAGLKELYICIEDILNLPLTQQTLAQHQDEKWVGEMLDDLISYLDVCSNIRDAILMIKESIRELQSALRRSKASEELSIESNVNGYFSSRKIMKKQAKKLLSSLKQNENNGSGLFDEEDEHLSGVVNSIREANFMSITIFSSLLLFLSSPILKPKTSTWSLLSKLVHKCESQDDGMNELENVDQALSDLLVFDSKNDLEEEKIQSAKKMLEILDVSIEELENELECLFRHLIHTRVSLLNIVSHQLE